MKSRIKIDSALVSLTIILSGILYRFPHLYTTTLFWDDILDFFGLLILIKGIVFRMAGRAHKKAHSKKGEGLVTTGLYTYVRNPMYLGSFLIGSGYCLLVWPWWILPFFAVLFYMRFRGQVVKEEEFLKKTFGKDYEAYCKKVPSVFPHIKGITKINMKKMFPLDELFSTKEKGLLIGLPLLAFVLELFQEKLIYNITDPAKILFIFATAIFAFVLGFAVEYKIFSK